MPQFAIYNDTIISVNDIYKFNIDKNSTFKCFECDNILKLRQCRNADIDSSINEHFYHQNNIKGTHITCENPISKITTNRDNVWHSRLSSFIKQDCREVIRKSITGEKHIVDVFCKDLNKGIELQHSHISINDIQSRDNLTNIDWIFDVSDKWCAYITIGNYVICEIPHTNWEEAVKVCKNRVFLDTGKYEWIILKNRNSYRIECNNIIRHVWIGKHINVKNVIKLTCLKNTLLPSGFEYFSGLLGNHLNTYKISYARCVKSMELLDNIHREYINTINFDNLNNNIFAIKAVAGSGKTTTLLNIAKSNPSKKFIYLAFNKSLIDEIKLKLNSNNITNIHAYTFDALIYNLFTVYYYKCCSPKIVDLRAFNISTYISWFNDKPFKLKEAYCTYFLKFCKNKTYSDINSGLDLDRTGFNSLMDDVIDLKIKNIYITHKDRLTRMSFKTIQHLFGKYGTNIVIISNNKQPSNTSNDNEIFEELISLMHIFSTTMYSNRRKNKINIYIGVLVNI